MSQKSGTPKMSSERIVKDIRRATRKQYSAEEKIRIVLDGFIRLVQQSHLPVRRTLEKLGASRATFYRWCDLYQTGGPEALEDRSPRPHRVWNRIPNDVRGQVVQLALDEPELSPRDASRTRKTILSRRLLFIACSRSTI